MGLVFKELRAIVNNNEYESVKFDSQYLDYYEKELKELNLMKRGLELNYLIVDGLMYNVDEEIKYIDNSIK